MWEAPGAAQGLCASFIVVSRSLCYSISKPVLKLCYRAAACARARDDGEEMGLPLSSSQSNSLLCDAHLCLHCIGYKNLLLEQNAILITE